VRNPHKGKIAITKAELDEYLNNPSNSLIKAMYDSLDDLLYSSVKKGYINIRTGELKYKKGDQK
jgi:hypothetical protein